MKSLFALFFLFAVSINLAQAQTTEIDLCLNDVLDITLDLDTLTADSVIWSQVSSGIWSTLPDSSDTTLTTDYNTLFVPSVTAAWDSIQLMAEAWIDSSIVTSGNWMISVNGPPTAPVISATYPDSTFCYGPGIWTALTSVPSSPIENVEYEWWLDGNPTGNSSEDFSLDFLQASGVVHLTATASCGTAESNNLSFNVLPALSIGEVGNDQIICAGEPVEPITAAGAFGGSGEWAFSWETSTNGGTIWNSASEDVLTFTPVPNNAIILSRFSATDLYGCGTLTSAPVSIEEYTPIAPGEVTWLDDTLCLGFDSEAMVTLASGGNEAFTWFWTLTEDTTTTGTASGSDSQSLSLDGAENTLFAQVEFTSLAGCGTVTSNWAVINVLPVLEDPEISANPNNAPICYGFNGPSIETTVPPTGADGVFNLTWEALNQGEWTPIGPGDQPYTPQSMLASSAYRLHANSAYGCGEVFSNTVEIQVYSELMAGTATGEQTICFDTAPSPLEASSATGGDGQFTLQWAFANSGESVIEPGTTESLWTPAPLTEETSFVMVYTSTAGCGEVNSNPVDISVLPQLLPGSILQTTSDTLCFGESGTISASPQASGVNVALSWYYMQEGEAIEFPTSDELSYEWLNATNEASFFVGYTSLDGCGTAFSDTLLWPVYPEATVPDISFTDFELSTVELCNGFEGPTIQMAIPALGASQNWSYAWQSSPEPEGPWTTINSGSSPYSNGPMTEDEWFRIQAEDGAGCGSITSSSLNIDVLPPIATPDALEDTLICIGSSPGPQTFGAATGADGAFAYQWIVSTEGSNLPDTIDAGNTTTLTLDPLTQNTTVVLNAQSTLGCGSVTSNAQTISVSEPLGSSSINVNNTAACEGTDIMASITAPTGGLGEATIEWHSNSSGTWSPIEGETESDWTFNLSSSQSISGIWDDLCGSVQSDTIAIEAFPNPSTPEFAESTAPCSGASNVSLTLSNTDWNALYSWETSEGATITSGINSQQILLDIDEEMENESIVISATATYPITGCSSTNSLGLDIPNSSAPPVAEITQMPGQDVLVCSDSDPCALYTWGWQNPSTGWDTFIEGETEQYALIPNFDPDSRWYFIDISYDCDGNGSACTTRSWFNHDPFVGLTDIGSPALKCYPNPASDHVYIDGADIQSVNLSTLQGQRLKTAKPLRAPFRLMLDDVPAGWYFIRADLSTGKRESIQLIVE